MPVITVFASSSPRTPRPFMDAASTVGRLFAEAGCEVVTGAGRTGSMQAVIDACLAAGGRARGVILRKFVEESLHHPELEEMVITETMRERKRLLGERVDGYLVLPGGPGTWEEFWEVAVERQIETHRRPLVLCDIDGFYGPFLEQAQRAADAGLLYGSIEELFTVEDDAQRAVASLLAQLDGGSEGVSARGT